jgi:hypothetical protein
MTAERIPALAPRNLVRERSRRDLTVRVPPACMNPFAQ